MLKNKWIYLLLLSFFSISYAQEKEIAITLDDLPFVGSANSGKNFPENHRLLILLETLINRNVPITGFIIAGSIRKSQWELLEKFRDSGFELGNHTYTHPCLDTMNVDKYIANVARADDKLQSLLTTPKYFRYPYLAEGTGKKKQKVYAYLASHEYIIAPVTIDSKDYQFNAKLLSIPRRLRENYLEQYKTRYLSYIWKQTLRAEANARSTKGQSNRQILLIHSNLLNSYFLGDVIDMYQQNGYKIISLAEALKAPAPTLKSIEEEMPNAAHKSIMNFLFKRKEVSAKKLNL